MYNCLMVLRMIFKCSNDLFKKSNQLLNLCTATMKTVSQNNKNCCRLYSKYNTNK